MVDEEVRKKAWRLGQLVMRARSHYEIWWTYIGADTRPKYVNTMNRYVDFFRFDEHANFVALVMYLSQLFEERRETLNLAGVVAEAEVAGVERSFIDTAGSALVTAKPIWKKVVILRSNLFAHRSGKLSYEAAFELAEITPDDLRDLAQLGLEVINPLCKGLGMDEFEFVAESGADTVRLLEDLGRVSG